MNSWSRCPLSHTNGPHDLVNAAFDRPFGWCSVPSHVVIETSEYRSNHGAVPRGRGNWAFGYADDANGLPPALRVAAYHAGIFWFNGTFSDAKRAAAKHYAARHIMRVKVLS